MLKLIKIYYTILSSISPKRASNSAFLLFQKVRKKDIRAREKSFFEKGHATKISFQNEDLDRIEYGQEHDEIILLVHGWDSNAGCMSAISEALVKTKKHIVSFNLPGHAYYKKSSTNFLECQLALQAILETIPKDKKLSIICHSFGSGIAAYALSETQREVDKLVFLTSPNSIIDIFTDFKSLISLGDKAFSILLSKAEYVIKEKIIDIEISEKLTLSNFTKLYLMHDKHDKVIPFKNSIDISKAIPKSTLIEYENIGHYRMLWNTELIKRLLTFF